MAVNIGPKIGIDGEAEYRKQINNIIQQAKTLSSEMKAVTSAFTAETAAQEKARQKAEVLNKQIETQKERVKALGEMLKKSAEMYGENDTRTLKWQQALNEATAELNDLEKELKGAESEMEDFDGAQRDTGDGADKTKSKLDKLGNAAKVAGAAVGAAVVAMAAGLAKLGKALIDNTIETARWADDLKTMSSVAGVSTQTLQKFEYAAGLVDVELEKIVDSLGETTQSMRDARSGSGDAAEGYKRLGIEVVDANGELRDSETVFYELIGALGEIDNTTERDALAFELLGESARELNPLIEAGAGSLEEFGKAAEDLGYILDDGQIEELVELSNAMDRLQGAADSMSRNLGAAFAPLINRIADEVIPAIESIASAFADVLNGEMSVTDFVDMIMGKLGELVSQLRDNAPAIIEEAKGIVIAITEGVNEALPELNPMVIDLINTILEQIILMLPEIVGVALQLVMQLASGIGEAAPTLIPAVFECIMAIIDGILSNIGNIIMAAQDLVGGLIQGIISAIPALVAQAPTLIQNFITGLIEQLPLLFIEGAGMIVEIIAGLISAIPELVMAIPNIIKAIYDAFAKADWQKIGKDITDGIKNGFLAKIQSLKDTVIDACRKLLNSVKSFLGIKSPSRVFAKQVGEMIPAGIAMGVDDNTPEMLRAVQSSFGAITAAPTNNYGGISLNVYGAEGQDVNALANIVMQKMQNAVNRKGAVFA